MPSRCVVLSLGGITKSCDSQRAPLPFKAARLVDRTLSGQVREQTTAESHADWDSWHEQGRRVAGSSAAAAFRRDKVRIVVV